MSFLFKNSLRVAALSTTLALTANLSVFPQEAEYCPDKPNGPEVVKVPGDSQRDRKVNFVKTQVRDYSFRDIEKAVAVNKDKVYVSFCVAGAPVKVNGWGRSEVRALVIGRDEIGFKIRQRSSDDKKPDWVEILAPGEDSMGRSKDGCLSGASVELDVPFNATVNISSASGESSIVIDGVKSAIVDISSGDIALSNIKQSISAQTDVGGVSVKNSSGKMDLKTTAGNIVAYSTESNDIGDFLKARTHSGAITMQAVDQKEVDARSFSGSIYFLGSTQPNGNYSFSTQNGLITLATPETSAFKLRAYYGGDFSSELSLKNIVKNRKSAAVHLTGECGEDNGAFVMLNSYSGTIRILNTDKPRVP